ncbi:hypothetical protein HYS94_01775 [Candidatus Daviesbacteria bacterium]|nr:hypothetical protein [Candidatus Daviesbacteria bacterium]
MGNDKLLPNQVYVVDKNTKAKWIYDIDPEDFDLIATRGVRDEYGNITLETPYLAALKYWTVEKAMNTADLYVKDLNVPSIDIKIKEKPPVDLSQLHNSTNDQLAEYLAFFGGYRAYLETQLSYVEAKKGILESSFEEGLSKMFYTLGDKYKDSKKPLKEAMHGESMQMNPSLKKIKQTLIETEAIYNRIRGLRDSYKVAWDTVSRVIALRLGSKEGV